MEYGRRRIVATTGELAALADGFSDGTPVMLDVDEIEPGHDPRAPRDWAVVARTDHLPLNEAGELAGPGDRIATGEPDAEGQAPLLFTPVLTLQSRKLAVPGEIGPVARAADPCQRRADAYELIEREGEAGLYLMELLEAVAELRREVAELAADRDRLLHPAARRHLDDLGEALSSARAAADHATRFGSVCELLRGAAGEKWSAELGADLPCDPGGRHRMLVSLPGMAAADPACEIHAALARDHIPDALVTPNPDT
ncbi:hypothetical protein ACIBEJ_07360 [Nonomuraea sp. NPDC050790]|uniref:hypothetical protein n=1 Tax=Nonomuraea sp. NPDC050790 TaxID=3364371 RepID=UPI0037B9465E